MLYRSRSDKIIDVVNGVALAWVAFAMLFPFAYIFVVSFSSLSDFLRRDVLFFPSDWTASAYIYILRSDAFVRSLFVTGYITVLGTVVNLAMTASMAYGLSRPIIGRRPLLMMVIFTTLFSAGLVPTYLVVKETGLIDSIWALIIPTAVSPFSVIVMRQFFLSIPDDLTEAALLDGANELRIFAQIILPLSKPALAAFGLFFAVGHWNSYFSAILYLNDPAKWPIQVVLRQVVLLNQPTATLGQPQFVVENPPPPETIQMAAILLAILPIILVYPFLQKHFAKGVMLGSIK